MVYFSRFVGMESHVLMRGDAVFAQGRSLHLYSPFWWCVRMRGSMCQHGFSPAK